MYTKVFTFEGPSSLVHRSPQGTPCRFLPWSLPHSRARHCKSFMLTKRAYRRHAMHYPQPPTSSAILHLAATQTSPRRPPRAKNTQSIASVEESSLQEKGVSSNMLYETADKGNCREPRPGGIRIQNGPHRVQASRPERASRIISQWAWVSSLRMRTKENRGVFRYKSDNHALSVPLV